MERDFNPYGEALVWCREVFGLCAVPSGTEADESLKARKEGHDRPRNVLQIILKEQKRRCAGQGCTNTW